MALSSARVFRPHWLLRLALALALLVWLGAALVAWQLPGASSVLGWKSLFFCCLFALLGLHYWPMEIAVDETALTYRGFLGLRRVPLTEISGIHIQPIPMLTNYDVRCGRVPIVFTSFIAGHRDLLNLLVQRARLVPRYG